MSLCMHSRFSFRVQRGRIIIVERYVLDGVDFRQQPLSAIIALSIDLLDDTDASFIFQSLFKLLQI